MIDNRQIDRGIFIGRNEQQMSRTRQVSRLHLSHRESLSHNAKKNIIDRYQSPRGLDRNNHNFGFESIIYASEGIIFMNRKLIYINLIQNYNIFYIKLKIRYQNSKKEMKLFLVIS